MIVIVLLCLACAAAHRFLRGAKLGDPGVLHAVGWLIASGSYVALADELIAPHPRALSVVAVGILAFSIGVAAGGRPLGPSMSWRGDLSILAAGLLALIAAAGFLAVLMQAIRMVPGTTGGPWFWELRLAVSAAGSGFGAAAYVANAGFAAAFVAVLTAQGRQSQILAWSASGFALAAAVIMTGRTFILLAATLLMVAAMRRYQESRWRFSALLVVGLGGIALGVLATFLQARNATDASSVLAALRFEWLRYVPVGLAAFSVEVEAMAPLQGGVNVFRTGFAVLKALGADVTVVPLVRPFVPVPFATNVYTAFSPYYADFGIAGVVAFFGIFGFVSSQAALRARQGHPVAVMMHAILLYALIMQFFQDQYLSLASQWGQLLVLSLLFALLARRVR